jgi:HAD superfamily hydrolase (TIGR01549 family)
MGRGAFGAVATGRRTGVSLRAPIMARLPIFDLDGTLLDTDEALVATFVTFGVPREEVTFGHVLADECARLGIDLDTFLDRYDTDVAQPFPGVAELVARLDRWALCSNKHPASGLRELSRLGWTPEVALFSDAFAGPKRLPPVLDALGLEPAHVAFIGDTAHDRVVAAEVQVPFGLAAWNPRAIATEGDRMLSTPLDVLAFCEEPVSSR